jgi:preprotein translocase subunit YajC
VYLLLIFVVVLLVFSMVQNNRRRKSTANMQAAIEPGVRIMTTSGIYGIVQEVEPDSIVIEISEGVDVRFAKAAVMKVVPHLDESDDVDDLDARDDLDDLDDLDPDAAATSDAHDAAKPGEPAPARVDGHQPGAGSVSTG